LIYTFYPHVCACPAHFTLFDFINLIILGKDHKL
jgi:hypothetical protein